MKQKQYLDQEFYALIKADESIFDFTEESALNGICYRDLQQPDNEWINSRLRVTLGYDSGGVPDPPVRWRDMIHPEDASQTGKNGAEQGHKTPLLRDGIIRFLHKDGSSVWMRCRGRVIEDGEGRPARLLIACCLVAHDPAPNPQPPVRATLPDAEKAMAPLNGAGPEKKLNDEHRLLRTIIDNVPINIYVKDLLSRKVLVNRAEWEYMGARSDKEIIGKSDQDLYPDESARLSMAEDRQVIGTGQSILGKETLNTRRDGSECWFLTSKIPLNDEQGRVSGLLGISVDITARKRVEIELQRTKELLEETNQVARVGGWELNLTNQKVHWSTTTKAIHEVPPDYEPDVQTGINFYKEVDRDRITQAMNACLQHGTSWDLELQILTLTGRALWVRSLGQAGVIDGVRNRLYGTFQDIDERKRSQIQAQESADLLRKMSDQAPGALYQFQVVGEDQPQFSYVSVGIKELFELDPAEITGNVLSLIARIHPADIEPLTTSILASKQTLRRWDMDFRVMLPTKGERWLRAEAMPEQLADRVIWNGYFQDVSVRKYSEQELSKSRQQAEAASQSKSEFLANMSHEIRTPLNGIIGFTDLLMRTGMDDTQQQYLSMVHQSANSLLDIVNDILDFSKIEAGKLELSVERTDLLEIGSQVADMIKYQAHTKALEMLLNIAPDVPRFAWIDPVRLRQILVNLLGNAVKFTEHGEVELRIETLPDRTPGCATFRFSVRDTGIGIDAKNQKKIFEAFTQEDTSTTRRFGGTGLGITISNKLLGLMNSRLNVSSQLGEGSTFYFDVSFRAAPGEPAEWENASQIQRVLIVDDNVSNRLILRDMLALKNIGTDQAANGIIALEKLASGEKYDLILMDYHMPYLDGIQTTRNIRKEVASMGEQQIILLHSSSDEEYVHTACNELSVPIRLVKPVRMQQLLNSFSRVSVRSHAYRAVSPNRLSAPPADASPERTKILIAEDNPINMLLATAILRHIIPGVAIVTAVNGKEAVEQFLKEAPALIFMDVQMPEMNGYEATAAIRIAERQTRVPIIALTAGTVMGERERCLDAGMDDYVTKPVVKNTLEGVVKKWLAVLAQQKAELAR